MSSRIVQLWFLVCVVSGSAFGIDLQPGVRLSNLVRIDGQKIYLELLTQEDVKAQTLELMSADLQSGYLETLFSEHSKLIDYDYVFENIDIKTEGNQKLESGESQFSRLYYVVRLKENNEIIGTSELHSVDDKDIALSLYIAKKHGGRGYGHDVVATELAAMEKITQAHQAIWECYADNPASVVLAQKSGFLKERGFLNQGRIVYRFARKFRAANEVHYAQAFALGFSATLNWF